MGALIRQQYIDPIDHIAKTREMHFDVEIIRPESSLSSDSLIYIKLDPTPQHDPRIPTFEGVMLHPEEQLSLLLDGKRTTNPMGCFRSRLIKPSNDLVFEIEDNSPQGLNAHIGDPIVVLSDLENQEFKIAAIVNQIKDNTITVSDGSLLVPKFVKGAIIENLANRWHPERHVVGAKTQLKRPSAPTFTVKRISEGVEILISIPITLSATSSYDVYVRDHPFHRLQLHWIPDITDAPEVSDRLIATTYNGGIDAGGGMVKDQQYLYAAVVAKDKTGFANATESSLTAQRVG